MNARALNALAGVICRAQENGKQTPMGLAIAVESAGMLMSPESAAELERLRERVAELEAAPALPWAAQMSDGDLHGFLDDLVSAAMNRWRSEPDVPDRETLAAIEKACAEWRTPGQGFRSDDEAVAS